MVVITNKQRRQLADQIGSLSATEHAELYRMLKHGSPLKGDVESNPTDEVFEYTRNANGVFFNLTDLAPDQFAKVRDFVSFCVGNNKRLDAYDQEMYERKMFHNRGNTTTSENERTNAVIPAGRPLPECFEGGNGTNDVENDWTQSLETKIKAPDRLCRFIERMFRGQESVVAASEVDTNAQKKTNQATTFVNARKRYAKRVARSAADDAGTMQSCLVPE